ncbi:MAG TPA: glycosyltransferase family 4 protein [Candidatus Acidoferrum sp.]|nr:glycosyltransferase family 4 protein [Candidatus Acidoferrum sp.]
MALRREARRTLGLGENDFAVLLIGNDWRKKGLLTLLEAATRMPELPIRLLVVSSESQDLHQALHRGIFSAISARVLPLRRDVEFYYAAADVYAGPSLEDTFALPVAEAMACGLPVIASAAAGVSEIITDGVDGLILSDPRDAAALEAMIRRLYENKDFRDRLGERAAETTRKYTWENNGRELVAIFQEIMRRKSTGATQTLTQES